MSTIKRIILGLLAVGVIYILGGAILSDLVFAQPKIDYANYFRPGDKLFSRAEGFDQTVLSVGNGWLQTRLVVLPNAAGPPEHFHEAFEEKFTVKSGTLSILVSGEKRTLHAGETISIPPMTKHKPFNETAETVIVESDDPKTLPVEFGYLLSQLYGFMDTYPNGPGVPRIMMQLSVYGTDADSWIADGPPLPVQKTMRFVIAPTARLLGYKKFYPQFKPNGG
ncbi:MAG TPA: cupin domain-containing protein [Pyrinomonadaceae bacterium]|nr:cupin domain-containing protein [Acidobacteriota bacterium]HQZ96315.1 cupin domain-containing protein [Pyrinomonadaceae bacterium]